VTAALVLCGLVHTAAAMALFGGLAVRPVLGVGSGEAERRLTLSAAVIALLTAVVWLLVEVADMASSPAAMLDPGMIRTVLGDTAFGRVWLGRLILSVAVVGVALRGNPNRPRLLLELAAVQLASLALVGHSSMAEGLAGALQRANQSLHLLAGGAWLGALPPLLIVLARARRSGLPGELETALRRFSGFGAIAVAILLATGSVNVWVRTGGGHGLFTTPYGATLQVKLALVATMIALALLNRMVLTPRLKRPAAHPLRWLTLSLTVETLVGVLVLGAAFALGNSEPPP